MLHRGNQYCFDLFFTLGSHALTRTGAGWAHEMAMHNRLGLGGMALVIFGSDGESTMQPSNCILPGTLGGLRQVGLKDSFYWMPSSSNFKGVDSVLGTLDGQVYTLQATIAADRMHHRLSSSTRVALCCYREHATGCILQRRV